MAMEKPFTDIDQPSLEAEVNSYVPGTGLAWGVMFPLKFTRKFDIKGIEGDEGIPVTADRVAFNTKAPLKQRKKIGSWSGRIAKIAVSRDMDEMDINEYQDAQTLAQSADTNSAEKQELVDMVYNDVRFVNNAMNYRVELDDLRIGCSGKHTANRKLDGDMATDDEINFNIPAANFKGAKIPWFTVDAKTGVVTVNPEANGLQDIIDAQAAIAKTGQPKPMFCYIEKQAFDALTQQTATAKRLYPRVTTDGLSTITAEMVGLEQINAFMDKNSYPHFLVIDTYVTVEGKDGTQETVKPWNINVATLSRTKQLGWTYWKPVPTVQNSKSLQTYGSFYKVTRYGEDNPMHEVTLAEGYVQGALINRKSMVLMNLTKTTWSNGN